MIIRKLPALWRACVLVFSVAGFVEVGAQAPGSSAGKGNSTTNPAAETAWNRLSDRAKPSKGRPAIDWAGVATEAADFRVKYPGHAHGRTAEKIELVATIRQRDSNPELPVALVQKVDAYLEDTGNSVRDRIELKIVFEQAKMRRKSYASRTERLQAQIAHAQELISEFPDQREGYGYKLALAKAESPDNARRLAEELIVSSAPEAFKSGARRVLSRLALEGQSFTLDGAESAIAAARGSSLVVYAWTTEDVGFLEIVQRLAKRSDTRFIGVNLDAASKGAAARAAALELPGVQLYDGAGLEGPAARKLSLIMTGSLYIIDGAGVVRFVNGHQAPEAKLTQLGLEKGFRP